MRQSLYGIILATFPLCLAGCGPSRPVPSNLAPGAEVTNSSSDPEKVRAADYSILFVGNSHISSHSLPELVGRMIRFRYPDRTVYSRIVSVGFLEDVARDPACREELESRPWKFVVLQAQKISMSGKHHYSRKEGLDIAGLAKARGAAVYFFSEWGLRGVKDDGAKQEAVYREMANTAGVRVARIGRAWDVALAARSELKLHDDDGNHQSGVGAFLTACVLYGSITGETPVPLAAFDYPFADEPNRRFLAETAARILTEPVLGGK